MRFLRLRTRLFAVKGDPSLYAEAKTRLGFPHWFWSQDQSPLTRVGTKTLPTIPDETVREVKGDPWFYAEVKTRSGFPLRFWI